MAGVRTFRAAAEGDAVDRRAGAMLRATEDLKADMAAAAVVVKR